MISLTLPWPHPDLSPNRARNVHWSRKAEATRNYRYAAKIITQAALPLSWRYPANADIPMTLTFCPPDKRRRDRTNMEASMKAGFDGIADALNVDDCRFVPTYRKGDPVKGGAVIVEIP